MGFLRGLGRVWQWSGGRWWAAMAMVGATIFAAVFTVAAAFTLAAVFTIGAYAGAAGGDIPGGSVVQPQELAQALKSGEKPVILYVGPKQFYVQAHIPGAEDMGAVGQPEGMAKLRARAARLPKDGSVVVYCGCCPWDRCPNIRPAFAELKKLGFSKVRVLYIEKGFGVDWAEKGLPVAKGE